MHTQELFRGKNTGCDCVASSPFTLFLMKPASILLCLLLIVGWCASASTQAGTFKSDALARSTQMIVVTTSDWNAVEGRLQRYERATVHEKWRPVGDPISIVVGKNGLGWGIGVIATDDSNIRSASDPVKREGDGKSPAGVFALGTAFGYASEPLRGLKMPYLNLTPSIECVDDPGSKYYNRIVDRSVVAADWNSSEHMRNAGESYRWGIVVDHNGIVTGETLTHLSRAAARASFSTFGIAMTRARLDALPCHKPTWKPCLPGSIRHASHCWYNYPSRHMSGYQSLDVAEID